MLLLRFLESRELEVRVNEGEQFNTRPLRDVLRREVSGCLKLEGLDPLHDQVYELLDHRLYARPFYASTLQVSS